MSVFVVILQLILVISIHELGHVLAASILGFSYDTIYIGLPIQPKKTFNYKGKEIIISPWLIGGGVNVSEEDLLKASFIKKTAVYIAGPVANIIAGFIVACFVYGKTGLILAQMFLESSFQGVSMLLTGHVGLDQLSSPVGIVAITHEVVETEFVLGAVIVWIALNLGIAVINLAPIPVLDGGRIWVGAICSLFGNKPRVIKAAKLLNIIFLILLLLLMLFLLIRDIIQLI